MDLFRLGDDENYDKICGQILFTTKGRLAYYCTFCGLYRDYESFILHLLEDCSKFIDDDLKEYINMPRLKGPRRLKEPKTNSNTPLPKSYSTETIWPPEEFVKNESSATVLPAQCEDLELQSNEESIKYDVPPTLIEENVADLVEYDFDEDYIINESVETEPVQIEYCEENIDDDYVNVECLEVEEITEQNQISYEIEQNQEIDNEMQVSYQLEQEELLIEEDTQNSYQLEQDVTIDPVNDLEETTASSTHSDKYTNDQCGENAESESLKEGHKLSGMPFVVRNVRARKIYLPSHIAPEERKFKCPVCGFAFKDRPNMNLHLRRHTNIKSYSCPDCDKKFYTSTEVRLHSRVHKKPPKDFLCTECGLAFETNYKLVNHQKRHNDQRDYVCEVCNKGFFLFGDLKRHRSSHSTERPYWCKLCGSTFKQPKGLKSHLKQHENKREYKCQLCDAAFNVQAGLYFHMKSKHKDS